MHTIRDVARLAGVSVATTSKVINNKGSVRPKTAKRVLEAMAALDYHPDQVARSLKVRQTQTIGIVIPDITNPFFTDVIRGVETEARASGYSLILADSNEDSALEEANLNMLYARRADGVLLAPTAAFASQDRLTRRRFPVVLFDRLCPGFAGSAVVTDNLVGAREATEHLISLGHKRIAIITGRMELANAVARLEGFRGAFQRAHLPLPEEYVRYGDFQFESGYRCGAELMQLATPPTAIFSCNNKMTLGLIRALFELHVACPQQVSVVGFDDFDWAANFSPRLTTVAQPTLEMGRQATRMLFEMIRDWKDGGQEQRGRVIALKPELRVRDSTAHPCGESLPVNPATDLRPAAAEADGPSKL